MQLIHEMTGPPHGPVTPIQTHEAAQTARINGYDILIPAGFSVDPEAQAFIGEYQFERRAVQSLLSQTPKEIGEVVFHLRDFVPRISKHRPALVQ